MAKKLKKEKRERKPMTLASPENIELFEREIGDGFCKLRYINNPNLKLSDGVPFKLKAVSPEMRLLVDFDLVVVLNEDIFDRLDDETQVYVIERLKMAFFYDSEKEKVVIKKPDFAEHLDMTSRFGTETCEAHQLAIKSVCEEMADHED